MKLETLNILTYDLLFQSEQGPKGCRNQRPCMIQHWQARHIHSILLMLNIHDTQYCISGITSR